MGNAPKWKEGSVMIFIFLYFLFGVFFFPFMLFHPEILTLVELEMIFLPYFTVLSILIIVFMKKLESKNE